MIEVKISVERDIYDKELKSITTIGTEETFALPNKYNNADKTTLIRGVKDFLEKAISQGELRNSDTFPEGHT